jgi:ATP-binding cassette, subfamily C (CFTR/MRP), member 4
MSALYAILQLHIDSLLHLRCALVDTTLCTHTLLCYNQVGIVAAVAGVGTTLVLIPVQLQLGRKFAHNRAITAKYTDERVRVMGEVLSGMASVKAFNWQQPFSALNTAIREK